MMTLNAMKRGKPAPPGLLLTFCAEGNCLQTVCTSNSICKSDQKIKSVQIIMFKY